MAAAKNRGGRRETRRDRLLGPEYERLRTRIKQALLDGGLTQKEVSARIGRGSNYLNQVLQGRLPVDIADAALLARALGITPMELLGAVLNDEPEAS